jgi:hypothetical protein
MLATRNILGESCKCVAGSFLSYDSHLLKSDVPWFSYIPRKIASCKHVLYIGPSYTPAEPRAARRSRRLVSHKQFLRSESYMVATMIRLYKSYMVATMDCLCRTSRSCKRPDPTFAQTITISISITITTTTTVTVTVTATVTVTITIVMIE